MKSEWQACTIGDLCDSVSVTYRGEDERVVLVNTSDVLNGKVLNHVDEPNQNLKGQFKKTFKKNDILYSEIRPANRRFAYIDFDETEKYIASTKLMVIRYRENVVEPKFLYFLLTSNDVIGELQRLAETRSGTFPQITFPAEVATLPVNLPPLPIQRKITAILSALDDKIETNNAICRNLEEQAMAVFKRCFYTPSEQQVEDKPVYDYAEYINGAAFKQHEYGEPGLPIIKIAELKSGLSSSTLFYSGEDKDEKYYIQNGDILFSWSGTPETSIDVFIWTRGTAILNQHIFNVKSRYGAKWFTYLMLKNYMPVFAKIASDKQTTGLGHVTVADLKRLTFPYNINQIMFFEKEVSIYMELVYNTLVTNNHLTNLRDTLLPKLMNGELEVETLV